MSVKQQLKQAKKLGSCVRIHCEGIEDGWCSGYVAALGPEFFALEILDKAIRPDSFNCMRYCDVSRCDVPAPYSAFIAKALLTRKLKLLGEIAVDASSVALLLRTAGSLFPLVTVHILEDTDVCYIGKVVSVTAKKVSLLEVNPGGKWEPTQSAYALDKIYRVDFGGAYEDVLHRVAESR